MAKNDVTITLKLAVVLGAGEKAKTHTAGSIVKVSDELATQLIEARAALPYVEPLVAELPPVVSDPVSGD